MDLNIIIHKVGDPYGRIRAVKADAMFTHSPREGFDNEKLGRLENDLCAFLEQRLNDAIMVNHKGETA